MNEPKIIEMYADGRELGQITKEEVIEYGSARKLEYRMEEWQSACGYLSGYTDREGICRLDMRKLIEEETPDYDRTNTVCMIFTALSSLDRESDIPEDIIEGQTPYISAKVTELEGRIFKSLRMEAFSDMVIRESDTAIDSGEFDECIERIMQAAPSVESCAYLNEEQKKYVRLIFELISKMSTLCSVPGYSETIEEYVKALS